MAYLNIFKSRPAAEEFETLVEEHLDGMYRVAMRYTRDPAMAEDLVHDTVERALRFRDRFELGTNFKAWIYTVLTHTFIHRYRRRKKEREILEGAGRYDVDRQLHSEHSREDAGAPENTFFNRLLSDDVIRALDALPEDFRTVVTLCDLEGLSYKEIADAIDAPVGTVMSRLYRGRRLLEKKLRHVAVEQGIIRETPEEGEEESRDILNISAYRRRRQG